MQLDKLVRFALWSALFSAGGIAFYVTASAPPAVGDWRTEQEAPAGCFEALSAVVDGKLYRFGGFEEELRASVESWCFDPTTQDWTPIAELPEPVTHVNAAVDGTDLWIAGGFVGDDPGVATDAVRRYDVGANAWSTGPPLPTARAGGALALVGRKLHYFGGFGADRDTTFGDHFVLDVDGGQAWSRLAPLPLARGHVGAAVVGGQVYAIGGQLRHDTNPLDLDAVHVYDPATDSWEPCSPLPTARSHCEQSTFALDDSIVVLGGRDTARLRGRFFRRRNPYAPLDAVTVYETKVDAWRAAMRLPLGLLGPSAHILNDRVLLIGGSANGPWEPQVDHYSLALEDLR